MKQLQNRDILMVILLSIISILCIFVPPLNEFPLRVVPATLLLFILPGYALITVLYPLKESFGLKKRILFGIILSTAITIFFSLISVFSASKFSYNLFFTVLVIITVLMGTITHIKRRKSDKSDGYLVCENCRGHYKLGRGEFPEDFKHCQCGGNLRYVKSDQNKLKKDIEPDNLGKKILKPDISLPPFEYRDVLLVILITFLSILTVSVPSLENSIVRMTLVSILIFFLSGYSLSMVIFPLDITISIIRRVSLSIILSLLIILLSGFLSLGIKSIIPIMAISIITVSLMMFSFIFRMRSSKETIREVSKKDYFKKPSKKLFLPWDILTVFLATVLCVIFVMVPILNDTPFRIILGLIFILFLPGYSLIAALFPKKDDLDNIERLALSFGLSISVTPLIGLLLNYTPFGIRLAPILISLSIFTILMCIIAFFRRLKIPEDERLSYRFRYHLNNLIKGFKRESKLDRILSVLLVLSIILAISMTIYVIVTPKQGEKFTEFYILGPGGKASDYPTNLTVGQTGTVKIGIVNHEYSKINYKVVVKLNNIILKEENVTLENKGKWEEPFTFYAARSGQKKKMEFLLYKLPDNKTVYRSLHLWINIK